jgi:hypothetical protein
MDGLREMMLSMVPMSDGAAVKSVCEWREAEDVVDDEDDEVLRRKEVRRWEKGELKDGNEGPCILERWFEIRR